MTSSQLLLSGLGQLPSVQWFVDAIVDDLSSRRSVLVLLPPGISTEEAWSLIRSRLWERDFEFRDASLFDLPRQVSPVVAMGSLFQVEYSGPDVPRTIESFIGGAKHLPDVLYLEGISELPSHEAENWLEFLKEWVDVSHSKADQGRPPMALCMTAQAAMILHDIPKTDIHFGVHWWWGFPSALEMKLLCRTSCAKNGNNALSQWREFLLPAMVSSDLSLAAHLWDALQEGFDGLFGKLTEYADMRGWRADSLISWGAEEVPRKFLEAAYGTRPPTDKLKILWACGALNLTPEYGLEVSTPALLILGKQREVFHRVWRGQAELLLPILDEIRILVCNRLTDTYGKRWPYTWIQPNTDEENEEVRKDPMACQLGYLEHLLKTCRVFRSEKKWLSFVTRARLMRNDLAHCRPVDFDQFKSLMREVGQTFTC